MLKELNYQSLDDLIDNTVPEKIKFKGELKYWRVEFRI